jgi:GAF domain-containing protein
MTPHDANVDLLAEVTALRDRIASLTHENAELQEALAQGSYREAATGEILRIISRSPADVQPVFDAVAESAARLCEAFDSSIWRRDGDSFKIVAHHGPIRQDISLPVIHGTAAGRAVLDGRTIHVNDMQNEAAEFPESCELARRLGFRTLLCVPLIREGVAIGVITLRRTEVKLFTDRQVTLLQTFADQAVIAIENVRLFNETKEALEQQTATSEILRVISSSPTDAKPVFDVIAASASRLCAARFCAVVRLTDGVVHLAAAHSMSPAWSELARQVYPHPLSRHFDVPSVGAEAILERRPVHVPDLEAQDRFPGAQRLGRAGDYRSLLFVPMLKGDDAIGAIGLGGVVPFTDNQIDLVKTFADQAVIAIENVRLFKELEVRNRDLTEALDQQTATSEILRVISSSPTDVQPVFATIVESAFRLCDAVFSVGFRFDGERLHLMAQHGWGPEAIERSRRFFPAPPDRTTVSGLAIISRAIVHIEDMLKDPEMEPGARAGGWRCGLGVPMLREGVPIGALTVARAEPRPFSGAQVDLLQTFADQAVIAVENVRLFNETKEALERQTATSEILRVISTSPTDIQPVLDALAESANRLCRSVDCSIFLLDGNRLVLGARHGPSREVVGEFTVPVVRGTVGGRTVLERRTIHVLDVPAEADEFPEAAQNARTFGFRTMLSVPIIREGAARGVIQLRRTEVSPFTERQAELLKTFADQAVIAIENVRLFNETKEALERQTATAEILRVISESPTNVQPVFDMIAVRATTLCEAELCIVQRVDGAHFHLAAIHGADPAGVEVARKSFPMAVSTESCAGRAVRTRGVVHLADVLDDPTYALKEQAHALRFRSGLAVPMLRDEQVIGAVYVGRSEPGLFSDAQVELLKTFADQAVIAIENVRLFSELDARNRDLTDALARQTATSEVLRVISRSQTDLQPVFAAILESAIRLCEADMGGVLRVENEQLIPVDFRGTDRDGWAVILANYPRPADRTSLTGLAVVEARVVHVPDVDDPSAPVSLTAVNKGVGFRSQVSVPILRGGEAIGVLSLQRRGPGPFSEAQIDLVKTFADQAQIAIENARLLAELQTRTTELSQSVGQLTVLGEVGQALSSTLDVDVVLNTIVTRANDLIGADGCTIFEYDEVTEQFHLRATRNLEPRLVELARGTPLRKGDQGILGQLPMGRQAVQVADITAGSYSSPISDALIEAGYRAVVAVPLIREDHLIGAMTMNRKTPGEFPAETIELLQTFATQSALAIQNARLFREIEEKSRQLEVASQHKSEFLANMSHELRTPLNAIIGFSEVLTDRMFGDLNEKQDEYLKDIYASGTHLLSLINDILDLSKIEAGRMELELTDFDLPTAIENALTLVRERAGRRSIALHTSIDTRLGQIQADERKIRQVVLNLLSNAIKFTPEGGRIEVRAEPKDGFVEISVSDTGVGIAPEDQEKVFEEFRQVGTAAKKVEGTGLGLTLCRKFVELHGGRISVKSEEGVGSTFTFTIPVRRGE